MESDGDGGGFSIEIRFDGLKIPELGFKSLSIVPVAIFLILLNRASDSIWIEGEFKDPLSPTDIANAEFYLEEMDFSLDLGEFGDFELEFDYGEGFFPREIEEALSDFNSLGLLLSISFWILIAWIITVIYPFIPNKPDNEFLVEIAEVAQKILPICSSVFFLGAWILAGSIASDLGSADWEGVTGLGEAGFSLNSSIWITAFFGVIGGFAWLYMDDDFREFVSEILSKRTMKSPTEGSVKFAIGVSLILSSMGVSAAIPSLGPAYDGPVRMTYYDWFQIGSEVSRGSETVTVSSGTTNSVIIDVDESMFGENETMNLIEVYGYYNETGLDSFCDTVSIRASSLPPGTDKAEQSLEDQRSDCSVLSLFSYTNSSTEIWGYEDVVEGENISAMKSKFIDSTDGYGEWIIEIEVEAFGSPLDNGEEVSISWFIYSYELEFVECGPDPEFCIFF